MNIELYVEGAAQKNDLARSLCRQAFGKFFESAGIKHRLRTIPCGGRKAAYDDFCTGLKQNGKFALLLVDSERAVEAKFADKRWQHLKSRDGWDKPAGASDDQVFLMAQVMETWFFADQVNLEKFFGKNYKPNAIPKWADLEAVPKLVIYDILAKATTQQYGKGNMSFNLLARIDPTRVENKCDQAKKLLVALRKL